MTLPSVRRDERVQAYTGGTPSSTIVLAWAADMLFESCQRLLCVKIGLLRVRVKTSCIAKSTHPVWSVTNKSSNDLSLRKKMLLCNTIIWISLHASWNHGAWRCCNSRPHEAVELKRSILDRGKQLSRLINKTVFVMLLLVLLFFVISSTLSIIYLWSYLVSSHSLHLVKEKSSKSFFVTLKL